MSSQRLRQASISLGLVVSLWSLSAEATFHLWQIDEVYSNASGTVQYIEFTTTAAGQEFLAGHAINVSTGSSMYMPSMATAFTFTSDLPGDSANHHFLVATQGFASLGIVAPDYVVPNGFLLLPAATINYAGVDSVTYASLPSDGTHAINRTGTEVVNSPTNFAGQSGSLPASAESASLLENPAAGSFQSGVGLVSGWSCTPGVSVGVDGGTPVSIPYGSSRGDTAGACGAGNTNTGFGFLLNYNLLGAGAHSAQLFVNGQPQGSPSPFTVTVPAGEFLSGVTKQVTVTDFPVAGKTTVLIWQQSQQNFAVMSVSP
ncbi:MAG TPA: hypothetical protein VIH36_04170 [Casimicrobiaceae bacterium]|jgi:hypothetical protein